MTTSDDGRELRRRPSARLLIIDPTGRLLLFRFVFKTGALAGQDYWATPGGGLEDGESFADAARRELAEETGIVSDDLGAEVARREFVLPLPNGESVMADERFFLVAARDQSVSRDGWTAIEHDVMTEHKWWSRDELATTTEQVWPENLIEMLEQARKR